MAGGAKIINFAPLFKTPKMEQNDNLSQPRRDDENGNNGGNFRRNNYKSQNSERTNNYNRDNNRPRYSNYNNNGERPRFNRGDGEQRPRYNNNGERPRFNRQDGEQRPRYNNGERPRFNPNRSDGEQRPRYNNGDRPRYNNYNNGERPRFNPNRQQDGERPQRPRFNDPNREDRFTTNRPRPNRPYNNNGTNRRQFNGRPNNNRPNNRPNNNRKPQHKKRPLQKIEFTNDWFAKNETVDQELTSQTILCEKIRLNRFIAMAGVCSRREADKLIADGEIKVNGEVITEMGVLVTKSDVVEYQGRTLKAERLYYILLNKPKNTVTTTDDPEGRRTVLDIVGEAVEERIYPVGRLDRDTTGVLLLTNDGELTEKLCHPKYEVRKIYHVFLDKKISEDDIRKMLEGIELEDGPIRCDDVRYVSDDQKQLGVQIHSGRNRIVRRIMESLGYTVEKLDRVYFAGLTKLNVPRGQWRFLEEHEINKLKAGFFR